jgi:hypothetical protein
MKVNEIKDVKPKMRERGLRICLNRQGTLKKKGVKQGFGVRG